MAETPGTYLGFDFGTRRLGIAVGESLTGAARPLTTLACRDGQPDWSTLDRLIAEWRPTALVVGRPCHADGAASDSTRGAERFARRLAGRTELAVHVIDERLSSHEAAERLRERGTSGRGQQASVDAVAAEVILESWFSTRGSA